MMGAVKTRVIIVLVLGLLAMALVIWVQSILYRKASDELVDLRSDIANITRAIRLTEQLDRDNAGLNNTRDDLRKDLEDAKGFNDPLDPDVLHVLSRLR